MICAIIPTLNSGQSLDALLRDISPNTERMVVGDGGSEDETLQTAAKSGAVIALGHKGRGVQLNRGARWAQDCTWLLFLHADSSLTGTWQKAIAAHIKNHPNRAGYFDFRFDSSNPSARLLEGLVRLRCTVFALPYGDQGLLISRDLYDQVGGYPDFPLFEDVALIRKLGKSRLRRLGIPLITSAAKYETDGFFRRGWRNFRLLRRYLKGETPETLAKTYR